MLFIQLVVDSLVLGSIYALMAIGFTMIFGILHIINLAHGELFVLGAFTAFFLVGAGVNFILALLIAMLVVAILGLIMERGVYRFIKKEAVLNTMLASIGLSLFLQNVYILIFGPQTQQIYGSTETINLLGIIITWQRLILVIIAVTVVILLNLLVKRTWFGKALRATALDPQVAQLMGIDTGRIRAVTFALGSALAAAAGALLVSIIPVSATSGFIPATKAFIITIFGGIGSITGAIVGALLLALAENLAAGYIASSYTNMIAYAFLVLVLLIRPDGIFGRRSF